jgi:prolipoprotein diacylglyceryltransferase
LAWTAALVPGKHAARWIDQGLLILFGALVGGRLVYVVLAWPFYQYHPLDIPQVWLGGLSGPGALGGGLLALVLLAAFTHQKLGVLADSYMPLAAALVVSVWLACWVDGAAYGAETAAWWGLPARDEWGDLSRRVPLQMVAACLALGVFWYIDRRRNSKRHGATAALALSGLGILIFFVALWRVDPSPEWAGLRPEAWAGLGYALVGAAAYLLARLPGRWGRRTGPPADTDILQNTS